MVSESATTETDKVTGLPAAGAWFRLNEILWAPASSSTDEASSAKATVLSLAGMVNS